MNKLTILIALIISTSAMGCSSVSSCIDGLNKDNYSVTITKGACFGQCPVYTATIYGDGSVMFDGKQNVENVGSYHGSISSEDLCEIVKQVKENDLESFQKEFIDNVPDAPLTVISISHAGKRNVIQWKIGTPAEVKPLLLLLAAATLDNKSLKPH